MLHRVMLYITRAQSQAIFQLIDQNHGLVSFSEFSKAFYIGFDADGDTPLHSLCGKARRLRSY